MIEINIFVQTCNSNSFKLAGIITWPNSLVGRALECKSRGRGFDPRLGHPSFYFCKKDFTLALVLKLPGEMPIQSQRTLSFSATQEVSKTLIKNQMTLYTSLPTSIL